MKKTPYYVKKPVTDDGITLHTYNFWNIIKIRLFHKCFHYPVVYTDGLISPCCQDQKDRTPWGILIGSTIIPLDAPDKQMSYDEALNYCKTITFAGKTAHLIAFEVLRYIKKDLNRIEKQIKLLGGKPFFEGIHWSEKFQENDTHIYTIDFSLYSGYAHAEIDNNKYYLRPIILF